jgi:hypothetical protein
MTENTPSPLGNVISIDDERIRGSRRPQIFRTSPARDLRYEQRA